MSRAHRAEVSANHQQRDPAHGGSTELVEGHLRNLRLRLVEGQKHAYVQHMLKDMFSEHWLGLGG